MAHKQITKCLECGDIKLTQQLINTGYKMRGRPGGQLHYQTLEFVDINTTTTTTAFCPLTK